MKTVNKIVKPRTPHFVGDGFRVHNFIPSTPNMDMMEMDPFINFDYNSKFNFSPTDIPRGVGVHPHKGFETVTIAYQGQIEHGDSSGGGGVIAEGDVQWMTAGAGILHKEFHETEWSKNGGVFQMVQLWVNLPAKYKNTSPNYQSLKNEAIARYNLDNENGFIEVIAGEYQGIKGSATTFSPIQMYNIKAKKGTEINFSFPAHYSTLLLVVEGEIKVNNGELVPTDHVVLMNRDGEDFNVQISSNAIVLILSGEPLKEPIAHHGPFVMNTHKELIEAFEDFQSGKFGELD